MNRMQVLRRAGRAAVWACGLALLGGCAAMHQASADVATYGAWPAQRGGGSYAFDRLPSQQAQPDDARRLEDAARPALARAGFQPVAEGAQPDVLVQVGARVSRAESSPWDDPFWWAGGVGGWRHGGLGAGPWGGYWGGYWGSYWGGYWGSPWVGYRRGPWSGPWGGWAALPPPRYDREVALLIRDRASGRPLFEARASSEGFHRNPAQVLGPLFAAALNDFPATGAANPRRVTITLDPS